MTIQFMYHVSNPLNEDGPKKKKIRQKQYKETREGRSISLYRILDEDNFSIKRVRDCLYFAGKTPLFDKQKWQP